MGKVDDSRCLFPLTSLQIGDLQSYLSDLSVFLALESNKFYVLVDNRPWLRDLGSQSAHLWQLMVTKSRLSPFANTKGRRGQKEEKQASSKSNHIKGKKFSRWFSLIGSATLLQKRVPVKKLPSSLFLRDELHRTLYGFIVFEVAWANVRGINYLNELQTDTSLAIEAKFMERWEFDSINQAANCISSWFSGTPYERSSLKGYLDSAIGEVFYDAKKDLSGTFLFKDDQSIVNDVEDDSSHSFQSSFKVFPGTAEYETSEPHTPPLTGSYKRRKVTKSVNTGVEVDIYLEETQEGVEDSSNNCEIHASEFENILEATQYRDVLILFRFKDPDLPFKLRQIIMSDLRLLTLLEAGLPSWVLFLQSYPGFCHLYRPWMCPLARALYVLISVVTVIIGFYDLYKNVPVLKATASSLCGPLFDWIETWEMVSRIKYLGTMLFLHNCQKAVKWCLAMTRATKSFFSVLILPLTRPFVEVMELLLPTWNLLAEVVESFFSVIWIMVDSSCTLVGDLVEIILLPIWFIVSLIWNIATSILYPIFWIFWEVLYVPIRIVVVLANFFALIFSCIFYMLGNIWQSVSSILWLASASEATVRTYEVSVWRSLWNDLFSQVFRAVKSILNGFVAFFTACNRHRLSIYNHIQDFVQRLLDRTPGSQSSDSRHGRPRRRQQHLCSQAELRKERHSRVM